MRAVKRVERLEFPDELLDGRLESASLIVQIYVQARLEFEPDEIRTDLALGDRKRSARSEILNFLDA